MAKKKLDIIEFAKTFAFTILMLALGLFFVSGGFMNVMLLDLLPLIVHQIVGWIIIGVTALGVIKSFT